MQRRQFLMSLGALVGGIAIEQAIPFNRVWSFPKEIKVVRDPLVVYERDANGIREAKDWLVNNYDAPGSIRLSSGIWYIANGSRVRPEDFNNIAGEVVVYG